MSASRPKADAVLRKRLRILLKPKVRQTGFNVHPNPPISHSITVAQ